MLLLVLANVDGHGEDDDEEDEEDDGEDDEDEGGVEGGGERVLGAGAHNLPGEFDDDGDGGFARGDARVLGDDDDVGLARVQISVKRDVHKTRD